MTKTPSKYLARIGAKGGAAGTGSAKRRSREHYVQAIHKRWGTTPPEPKPEPLVLPPPALPPPPEPKPPPKPVRVLEQRKDRWRP